LAVYCKSIFFLLVLYLLCTLQFSLLLQYFIVLYAACYASPYDSTVLRRGWDWAQYYLLSLHWQSKLLPTKLFPKQGYHLQTRLYPIVEHLIHNLGQQKETCGSDSLSLLFGWYQFRPPLGFH
jgi:hypothetical protein